VIVFGHVQFGGLRRHVLSQVLGFYNPYYTIGGQRRTIAFRGSQNESGSVVMDELQSAGLEGG
jgi:hypothetical protein